MSECDGHGEPHSFSTTDDHAAGVAGFADHPRSRPGRFVQRLRSAKRDHETGRAIAPLVRDESDGSLRRYRYCMVDPSGDHLVYADQASELVSVLLGRDDYPSLDPFDRLTERIRYATTALVPIQALLSVEFADDVDHLSVQQRRALFAGPNDRAATTPDSWPGMPPLVLLSTNLPPFGPQSLKPKPLCTLCGDVADDVHLPIIDALTDLSLLESLASVGHIDLAQAKDVAP